MNSIYLTPKQLSQRLSIPVATLAKWRFLGRGPAFIKFGSSVRYADLDVDVWLADNRKLQSTAGGAI